MNFLSHLLPSKGDKGSAEHPVAEGHFPPARKSPSTTTSPHTSPPASPRFKPPPPAHPISPARPGDDVQSSAQQAAAASSTRQAAADGGNKDEERDKHIQTLQTQLHTLKRERAAQDARYVALAAQHQKDQELHESSLDQLRQHMAHMNDSLALLREDRELLNREVFEGRETNRKLQEESEQLKVNQDELTKICKNMEERLATISENELAARKFAANTRSIEDAQTDAAFRQRFNLPVTEFPVTSYYCCHKHIYHGWLYITPAYMCFEPALLSKESTRIATPLNAITALVKTRGFKYIPGTDNALVFKTKSGADYFFNNFTHRDSVIANVVHQAAKFGHRIQSQDEKQSANEGKEPKRSSEGAQRLSKDTDSLPSTSTSSTSTSLSSSSSYTGDTTAATTSSGSTTTSSLPQVASIRARSLSDVS